MYDSSEEPCCIAHVTSGGRDEHEPGCREAERPVLPTNVRLWGPEHYAEHDRQMLEQR